MSPKNETYLEILESLKNNFNAIKIHIDKEAGCFADLRSIHSMKSGVDFCIKTIEFKINQILELDDKE